MKFCIKKINCILFMGLAVILGGCFDDNYNCEDKETARQALDIGYFDDIYGKYSKGIDKIIDDYKSILEVTDILLLEIDDKAKTSTCKATFRINLENEKNKNIYAKILAFSRLSDRELYSTFNKENEKVILERLEGLAKVSFSILKDKNEDTFDLEYNVYDNNRGESIIEVYQ